MAILLAALVALILIGDSIGLRKPMEPPFYGDGRFSARILESRTTQTSGYLAVAEVDSVDHQSVKPFRIRIHFLGEEPYVGVGETVGFSAGIKPLEPPICIPDAVDLQRNYRIKGVVATTVVHPDSIRYIGKSPGLLSSIRRANSVVEIRLKRSPLSAESIEMLSAMLLGNTDVLPDDTRAFYTASGLAHILALSGLHVGIIAMVLSMALWPFYLTRHVRTRLLLTACGLWLYAAFTGFSPSVTRAVIMATVYIGARVLERKSSSLNSLCMAAFLILLFSPSSIYSVGFQLSFVAVLGIIVFYPLINRVDMRKYPLLYRVVSYPALSISAMIFTGLVAAYYFHTFPLYFILANVAATPIIPLFIVSGIFSLLFNVVGFTDWLADALNWVAGISASLPSALVDNIYPSAGLVIGLCVALTIIGLAVEGKSRVWLGVGGIVLGSIVAVSIFRPGVKYPSIEEYAVHEPRSNQLIVREGRECTLFTSARITADREVIHERYSLILRDFLALRKIDTLRLGKTEGMPIRVIGDDSCYFDLDSLVYRPISSAISEPLQ